MAKSHNLRTYGLSVSVSVVNLRFGCFLRVLFNPRRRFIKKLTQFTWELNVFHADNAVQQRKRARIDEPRGIIAVLTTSCDGG